MEEPLSALARLAVEDFAAVVVALLERGEVDRTLRIARAVVEASDAKVSATLQECRPPCESVHPSPATSVHSPSVRPDVPSEPSRAACADTESSTNATDVPPSRPVLTQSSTTTSIYLDSSQKRDGRRPFERPDGRFAPVAGDDELEPPSWAARKYSTAIAKKPELPPLEEIWASFVHVTIEYGKHYATIDGLKKAFGDFLRLERVAPKQESLPFETTPASSRRPPSPPPPPKERPKIEAPLDFSTVFASAREHLEKRIARTQASAPPGDASAVA